MIEQQIEISKLKDEEVELIKKHYTSNIRAGYIRCNGFLFHDGFENKIHDILKMDVRDDDVWICSLPKAGTTWTQEMVWCITNDLNFSKALEIPVSERFIFLDACYIINLEKFKNNSNYEELEHVVNTIKRSKNQKNRRFIKTHLPFGLLPSKFQINTTRGKIIYVARNPRDACISSFHHRKLLGGYRGNLEEYCDLFMRGLVTYGPYWNHIFSYWNQRYRENVLFIKFEDMKKNLPAVISKVTKFLGKELTTDEVNTLCRHLSFENMKNNPAVNTDALTEMVRNINEVDVKGTFMRKGDVGQWKNDLKQNVIDRFEKWELENLKNANATYGNL